MTDPFAAFRRVLLLVALPVLSVFAPSGALLAGQQGNMLSVRDGGGKVQEALLTSPDSVSAPSQASPGTLPGRLAPGKVALISVVAPGFGQIYNHAAWKLPIYYGLLGYFAAGAVSDNSKYLDNMYAYRADPNGADATAAADRRDDYRKRRNSKIVWFCVTYLVGVLDAYVDAHLFDFDRVQSEGLGDAAPPLHREPAVSLSMKF